MARHTYSCPLRWADMDQLGHVNNVTYVDYLQEARVDMLRLHAPLSGGEELAEGVVVVRHDVDFLHPLVFRSTPVLIDVWVTEVRAGSFTLAYEVYDEAAAGRVVYLRARSLMAPYVFATEAPRRLSPEERAVLDGMRAEGEEPRRTGRVARDPGAATPHLYPCHVRFSDVDVYRHVNNVKYFEYIQEARIDLMFSLERPAGVGPLSLVVGGLDVEYYQPLLLRAEPYPVTSWISRIGRSSFEVTSAIADGDRVYARARAAMVTFDAVAQRSQPIPGWVREHLVRLHG